MQRELANFPFPPAQRWKLQEAGFTVAKDVIELRPSELSQEIGVTMEEALDIIKLVKQETEKITKPFIGDNSRKCTVLEALQDERSQQSIVTFSESMDEMLGGGVPLAKITEFCGAPGIGKTQVSIQLCVDVQIPEEFGGCNGEAVFIDTEGSFIIERVVDVAKSTVEHCQHIADMEQNQDQVDALKLFTLESVLRGIYCFRCHNYTQLIALVHTLPDFLKQHDKVRLIVVDSIAFHFRHDFEDYVLRSRLLNSMAQSFIKMATLNKLAVVLTNQMTTRIQPDAQGGSSHLTPALGESWGHASTIRVIFFWRNGQRHALLYKSPSRAETVVRFQITTGGIRDLTPAVQETQAPNSSNTSTESDRDQQPMKRQRVT